MSCSANKSNKVISQSGEISPTEHSLAAKMCLLLLKLKSARSVGLISSFPRESLNEVKTAWLRVSCFSPGTWVLRNHAYCPLPLVYLNIQQPEFLTNAFPFRRQSHDHHPTWASDDMLVNIILDCPTWIQTRRCFLWICQGHITLCCLVFLSFVKPHKSITF